MGISMARKTGSINRGYYFRSDRGWCVANGKSSVILRDENGDPLKVRRTPTDVIAAAADRVKKKLEKERVKIATGKDQITVADLAEAHLHHLQTVKKVEPATFKLRRDYAFDFRTGFSPKWLNSKIPPKPSDRLHEGFGNKLASDLTLADIRKWFDAHPGWDKLGGQRFASESIMAMLNFGLDELECLSTNPLRHKLKIPKGRARATYLTVDEEAAMLAVANPEYALAMKVLIRTGARPQEFAKLTAKQVAYTDKGVMKWTIKKHKTSHLTDKPRVIYVVDKEIEAIVKEQMGLHPDGALFRTKRGRRWTPNAFKWCLASCVQKLPHLDLSHVVTYTFRHSYAKRTLCGFWNGTPITLEYLAFLMGNSVKVCRQHYASWVDSYLDAVIAMA
jgi:integrase